MTPFEMPTKTSNPIKFHPSALAKLRKERQAKLRRVKKRLDSLWEAGDYWDELGVPGNAKPFWDDFAKEEKVERELVRQLAELDKA